MQTLVTRARADLKERETHKESATITKSQRPRVAEGVEGRARDCNRPTDRQTGTTDLNDLCEIKQPRQLRSSSPQTPQQLVFRHVADLSHNRRTQSEPDTHARTQREREGEREGDTHTHTERERERERERENVFVCVSVSVTVCECE